MRRTFWTLLAILGLAFALRVHWLGRQELRGDEGFSWNYIQDPPGEILARIIREGDPQPPIHYWLLWGWAKLTGESEFSLRAWSALLSLMLVPLIYQVGRQLWRGEIGLLAAGLTAVHPQQIWLAQDARNMYQLALIGLLAATLLLPRLLRSGAARYWLGYVAGAGFAMYSHYYALFPLIAHGGWLAGAVWSHRANSRERSPVSTAAARWISAGLAVAALVAPWAAIILPVYARGQLTDPGSLPLRGFAAAVLGDLAAGPAFAEATKLVVVAVFGGLCLIPFFDKSAARLPLLAALLAGVVLPFLGIYGVIALRATFNSIYFIIAFPAAYLLAAGGAYGLYRRSRPLGAALLALALFTYSTGLRNLYADPQYGKTRGVRDAAAHLAEAAQPGDIFLANFPDPAQLYYLRHLDLPYYVLPGSPDFDPAEVDAALSHLLTSRLWFMPINARNWDPNAYVEQRLLDTALLVEDDHFDKMRLMLFQPPASAVPLNAQFADGIRLVGYRLESNRLTLVWTADESVQADYTVFVHALAADGFNVTSHDAPPVHPTSTWQPGRLIVDAHEFAIPADQPIALVTGLYLPATGQRLHLQIAAFGEPDAALIARLNWP